MESYAVRLRIQRYYRQFRATMPPAQAARAVRTKVAEMAMFCWSERDNTIHRPDGEAFRLADVLCLLTQDKIAQPGNAWRYWYHGKITSALPTPAWFTPSETDRFADV